MASRVFSYEEEAIKVVWASSGCDLPLLTSSGFRLTVILLVLTNNPLGKLGFRLTIVRALGYPWIIIHWETCSVKSSVTEPTAKARCGSVAGSYTRFPIEMTMKQVLKCPEITTEMTKHGYGYEYHWMLVTEARYWTWILFCWIFIRMLKEILINNLNNQRLQQSVPKYNYVTINSVWLTSKCRFQYGGFLKWGYPSNIQVMDDPFSTQTTMVTWGSPKTKEHPAFGGHPCPPRGWWIRM